MGLMLAMFGLTAWLSPVAGEAGREVSVVVSEAAADADGRPELRFEVVNKAPKTLRFCIWQTPLEGFTGDILDVRGPDGEPRTYLGPSVKRRAPGPDDDAVVPAGATLATTFGLAAAYDLSVKGRYVVRFRGNPALNGLPDSAPLTLEVR